MSGDLGNSMEMPYESGGQGPMLDDHVHFSSGVVVMGAKVDMPEIGPKPALVFRFAIPNGSGFYPPVCLVLDDDQMAKTRPLINAAIHDAREAARAAS